METKKGRGAEIAESARRLRMAEILLILLNVGVLGAGIWYVVYWLRHGHSLRGVLPFIGINLAGFIVSRLRARVSVTREAMLAELASATVGDVFDAATAQLLAKTAPPQRVEDPRRVLMPNREEMVTRLSRVADLPPDLKRYLLSHLPGLRLPMANLQLTLINAFFGLTSAPNPNAVERVERWAAPVVRALVEDGAIADEMIAYLTTWARNRTRAKAPSTQHAATDKEPEPPRIRLPAYDEMARRLDRIEAIPEGTRRHLLACAEMERTWPGITAIFVDAFSSRAGVSDDEVEKFAPPVVRALIEDPAAADKTIDFLITLATSD